MGNRTFRTELYERFLREAVDHALIPPEIRPNPSLRYYPEIDDYTMSCGMDRTPGGRIWLAWFGGGDDDRAVILLAKSDDDGRTFGAPEFVLDAGYVGPAHLCTVVGNLWSDPDGKLHLFFTLSLGHFDGRAGCWDAVCENPDSDTPSWSTPRRIWHGCALNKPTVLADGRWLLPINLWKREQVGIEITSGYWLNEKSTLFPELDPWRRSNIFISRDRGKSWEMRGGALNRLGRTFDEPMVVERKDGSLWMLQRNEYGITECESHDGGDTWSVPKPFALPNASARFFLRKLASGRVLLVKHSNPADPAVRSHLEAYLSDDDGVTWNDGLMLDQRSGISYPDGFQAPDGRIFIQYDRDREHGEILMTVFREEDVDAGQFLSEDSRRPYPVILSATKRAAAEWSRAQ